jgi:diacylglycerol kinase family enzyme
MRVTRVRFVLLVAVAAAAAGVILALRRRRHGLPGAMKQHFQASHPVLIINPLSGDGKAKKYGLEGEAVKYGIETVIWNKGEHLEQLTEDAIDRGCDLLMVGGGDGSLAAVSTVAMKHNIRFACVPVGTRSHFAMDLGLDRNDPLKAIGAAIDGIEVEVNVGRVNDRVFLNNVSFGVYADALADPDYRDHRAESMAHATEEVVGKNEGVGISVKTPAGKTQDQVDMLLVSNNP